MGMEAEMKNWRKDEAGRPLFYCFAKNGAVLNTHDTLEDAIAQARQWKVRHPEARILVEEHVYLGFDGGFRRTWNDIKVELPMCVPELTRKYDQEYLPALDAASVRAAANVFASFNGEVF